MSPPAVTSPKPAPLRSSSPARWAAEIGLPLGVVFAVAGVWLIAAGFPLPLGISFIVIGAVEIAASWFARYAVRAAWAVACSLNGTLAVMFLFGSFKLRDTFDVHLGVALVPSLILGTLTVFYATSADDY